MPDNNRNKSVYGKIMDAMAAGVLLQRVGSSIHSYLPLYLITNKNVKAQNHLARIYRKLDRQYKNLIEKGADDPELEQKSSDKVWICWFQGYNSAPELVKAAISSIKRNMPEKKIIILTEDNIPRYAKFPKAILDKRRQGRISHAQFSDLLRAELLCRHGGMWVDATVLCTSDKIPKYISDTPLFVYKSLDLTGKDVAPTVCSSWLISAYSNHPILLLTRKLLWQYWEDYDCLIEYFIFHIFFAMAARRYPVQWEAVPVFNNVSPHVLQGELTNAYTEERWKQIKAMSSFHKLNHHMNFAERDHTFYKYIVKEYSHEEQY